MKSGDRPSPEAAASAARAGAILTIDLDAIKENYRRLAARLERPPAAVVKADAYGLGAARVAPALADAGARTFFVALAEEAIRLRRILDESERQAEIYVLNGPPAGCEAELLERQVTPVLNSLEQIAAWQGLADRVGRPLSAAIHIDSGMNRLGLPDEELDLLAAEPAHLDGVAVTYVMSHLACAEERQSAMNPDQLARFRVAMSRLPPAQVSFANSSGIFLGADYHFHLCRPGAALYGINPTPGHPNPMTQVVRLQGKILQVREIDAPQSVGYGATHRVAGPTRIATVGVGYADGHLRALSNRGGAFIGGKRVAVVGRVSMDLTTLDVTDVPRAQARTGALVDLIDPDLGPDTLADEAGTIGYEILTALGQRHHRHYKGG